MPAIPSRATPRARRRARRHPLAVARGALASATVTVAAVAAAAGCGAPARTAPAPGEPPAPVPPAARAAHAVSDSAELRRLRGAFAAADTLRLEIVAPGLVHAHAWEPAGPWAVHVLSAAAGECGTDVVARKAGPPLAARATTSDLARGALAAVNADFFMTPGGTPVGAHVEGGRVLAGPGDRPVFAMAADGPWIDGARVAGELAWRGGALPIARVNRPPDVGPELTLHDEWHGTDVAPPAGGGVIGVRRIGEAAGAGGGHGVVLPATSGEAPAVVFSHGPGNRTLPAPGDTVRWQVEVRSAAAGWDAREVVGGSHVLVRAGHATDAVTAGERTAFITRRHPRTAVGYRQGGGRLLLVVVDGRQAPYSDGMALDELAALLVRLGADEALNLDGGGSTAMVVEGAVVNRPSDAGGERAVANALVLLPAACGGV
jgi:hypothetical protein